MPDSDSSTEDRCYEAYCMHKKPIAIVDIWMRSCDVEGDAVIPECCYPNSGSDCSTLHFTYMLACETQCPDDYEEEDGSSTRKLADASKTQKVEEQKKAETVQNYCSRNDYPCGDNDENVHVCHYSAREGYQTFCVPESDSAIVAYYPKDYCGRCVGGYKFRDSSKYSS